MSEIVVPLSDNILSFALYISRQNWDSVSTVTVDTLCPKSCIRLFASHYHNYADLYKSIGHLYTCHAYSVECVSTIKSIFSNTFYVMYGVSAKPFLV